MNKILLVIDMQNDFVSGSLGTNEAQNIIPNVVNKIKNWEGCVVATFDTHRDNYMETREGKYLPVPHCIFGTEGHQLNYEVEKAIVEREIGTTDYIYKNTFGSINLPNTVKSIIEASENSFDQHKCEIEIIGLCTDICVISNALILKANFPEMNIAVDASCCAGVTPEKHKAAIEVMKSCQINIINE